RQMMAGVVLLALGTLAVVVGPRGRVLERGERGEEERPFELLVAASRGLLAADRCAGAVGDGRDAGVGGQVAGCGEGGAVADLEQDSGCGPDPDAWHGDQDPGKRVVVDLPQE